MKVLILHNRYLIRGGEDASTKAEEILLTNHGHDVTLYEQSNEKIAAIGRWRTALRTVWSIESYHAVSDILKKQKPDVVSIQNSFPLLSPSIYYAARKHDIPVIQTLRNYRLLCLNAYLMRNSKTCEICVGKTLPFNGVLHSCYRNSFPGSLTVCAMLGFHKLLRTWQKQVTFYIALTEFAKNKFIEGGLPEKKILVKPNFILDDPGVGTKRENYALFVGRLSEEKGILPMVLAWKNGGFKEKLLIAGDGPLMPRLNEVVGECASVVLLGRIPSDEVNGLMKHAAFLVFPSVWYEGMPRTIIEAFACGLPVFASKLGGMAEMIEDGVTGRLFSPGDSQDLTEKIEWAWSSRFELAKMGQAARKNYELKYSAEKNYEMLIEIYNKAIAQSTEGRTKK